MRRASVLLFVIVIAVGATAASADGPVWSPAFTLATSNTETANFPQVAVAPTGAAVTAWELDSRGSGRGARASNTGKVFAALRLPGGGFAPAVQLSSDSAVASAPRVAEDAAGDATVVWVEQMGPGKTTLRSASAPAGQPFGAAADVSKSVQSNLLPALAEDAAGDAAVAFNAGRAVLVSTRTGAAGTFGAEETAVLSVDPQQVTDAMNPAGDLAIGYNEPPDSQSTNNVVSAIRRPHGGAYSAPVAFSAADQRSFARSITIDPAGRITEGYINNEGTGSNNAFSIRANTLAPGATTAGTEQTLTPDTLTLDDPELATDSAGNVTAVWSRFIPSTPGGTSGVNHVETATAPAGQAFAPFTTLDDTSGDQPSIGDDPAGDTVIAWARTATPPATGIATEIAQRPAGATAFSAPTSPGAAISNSTKVSLVAANDATVVWGNFASGVSTVLGTATGSGTAPAVTPTPSPGATPTPTPGPSGATFSVSIKVPKRLKLKVLRHKKRFTATCTVSGPGTCALTVTVPRKKKKKHAHASKVKRTTVAKGKVKLSVAGSKTLKVKFSRKGLRLLRHRKRPLKLTVTAKAGDTSGHTAVATKRVRLR